MSMQCVRIFIVGGILAAGLAPSANASCSDRPGTPDKVSVEAKSTTSIRFNWRITTRNSEPNRYYDLQVFEEIPPKTERNTSNAPKKVLVRNLAGVTGQGPYFRGYGGMDFYEFTELNPGTRYCVWISARTMAGTEGCSSALHSAQPCTTTHSPPQKPGVKEVPGAKVGQFLDPSIRVQRHVQDRFRITGDNFTPMKTVKIRVSGRPTTGRSREVPANGKGSISALISGACDTGAQGDVTFMAQDSVKQPKKPVTATARCRGGVDPSGIKVKP